MPPHASDARLIYELPRPAHDGRTAVRVSPFELLDRLARLMPPQRGRAHQASGVHDDELAEDLSTIGFVRILGPLEDVHRFSVTHRTELPPDIPDAWVRPAG